MTKLAYAASIVALLFVSSPNLSAGSGLVQPSERGSVKSMCTTAFPFEKGAHEIEFGIGVFGSPWAEDTAKRPDMAFAIGELRAGWMLSDPHGDGFLRGNWEFVLDVFGGGIFDGPGDVLVGAEMLLRYNFIQPGSRLVPFIHIGGGGVCSDAADDDPIQHLIGTDFSFILEGEIGLRWKLNERCAISCGIDYRHISNAGLASHNAGLNALGGLIGISIFY
jgi:lipid A 3-O-deacylase